MQAYEIRRIRSGIEETYAWVSSWFRMEGRNLEVLHLVCGKTADDPITGRIYLERHDQAVACYGGAKQVLVREGGVDLRLNRDGINALRLDAQVSLVAPDKLVGWKKAVRVFSEMASYPTCRVIEIA